MPRLAALPLLCLALAACTDGKESAESAADLPPTLAADIQPIFNRNCIACHAGDAPASDLDLSEGRASTELVGVISAQVGTMVLVEPGSVEASYLWYKINSTHQEVGGFGTRMPPEFTMLSTELALFEAWIEGGAD